MKKGLRKNNPHHLRKKYNKKQMSTNFVSYYLFVFFLISCPFSCFSRAVFCSCPFKEYFPANNRKNSLSFCKATMESAYQHERRENRQNTFGDLDYEEDKYMGEVYANFLMLYSLASNDNGFKIMFGVKKEDRGYA